MYIFLVIKLLLVYTIAHQIISVRLIFCISYHHRTSLLFLQSRIEIGTKSFRCYEVNKEFIHNCTCKILPNNRTSSLFYANFFMKRTEHISLSLEIFRKTSVQYLPWILRFSVDCCEIVENSNHEKLRNPAIRIIVDVFRLAYPSVFVSGCPYEVIE